MKIEYSKDDLTNAKAVQDWQQQVSTYQGKLGELVPENFTSPDLTVNGKTIVVREGSLFKAKVTVRDALHNLLFGGYPPEKGAAEKICRQLGSSGGIAVIQALLSRLARHDGAIHLDGEPIPLTLIGENSLRYKIEWTYVASNTPSLQAKITADIYIVTNGKDRYYLPLTDQKVIKMKMGETLEPFSPLDSQGDAESNQGIQGNSLLHIEIEVSPQASASPTKNSTRASSSSSSNQLSASATTSLQVTSIVMSSNAANISIIPGQNTNDYKKRQDALANERQKKQEKQSVKQLVFKRINGDVQIQTHIGKVAVTAIQGDIKEISKGNDAQTKTMKFTGSVYLFGCNREKKNYLIYVEDGSILCETENLLSKGNISQPATPIKKPADSMTPSASRNSLSELPTLSSLSQLPESVALLTFTATVSYSNNQQATSSSATTSRNAELPVTNSFKIESIEMTTTFGDRVLIIEGQNTEEYKQAQAKKRQIAEIERLHRDAAELEVDEAQLGSTPLSVRSDFLEDHIVNNASSRSKSQGWDAAIARPAVKQQSRQRSFPATAPVQIKVERRSDNNDSNSVSTSHSINNRDDRYASANYLNDNLQAPRSSVARPGFFPDQQLSSERKKSNGLLSGNDGLPIACDFATAMALARLSRTTLTNSQVQDNNANDDNDDDDVPRVFTNRSQSHN
jgi:flagellar basal body rod protein FlgC